MAKKKFYAVTCGRSTGVFDSWDECLKHTRGFPNTKFKGFQTKEEALHYLQQHATQDSEHATPNKRQRTEEFSPVASSGLTAEANRLNVSSPWSPSSPEVVGVKTWNQAIQERFEMARTNGEIVELNVSCPPSPASPEVVGVKTPNQAIQEKFDMALAKGEIVELMSPDNRSTCPVEDTCQSSTTIASTKHFKVEKDTDNVKIKMDFESEAQTRAGPSREPANLSGDKRVKITDVLGAMLELKISEADSKQKATTVKSIRRMEGDIPQLGLHKSFFVQGVRVGWPYPVIMPPQRQIVNHVIMALKRSLSVVIESPTGTGKSAALLCAVLSWQRWHAKCSEERPPKIFYCSRTHSQVEQMVASLKKTPYRPRMSVLGSRERLCIHREIKPRDGTSLSRPVNTSLACQIRVKNTEKYRKDKLGSYENPYDDDNPPFELPNDRTKGNTTETENEDKKLTCEHYRQLTRSSLAASTQAEFAPSQDTVNCCSIGGERTKLGTFDIEDLVSFGMNPSVHKVAIYRGDSESYGLSLGGNRGECKILQIKANGPAYKEGTLRPGDTILMVNGKDMRHQEMKATAEACRTSKDPLELQVIRSQGETPEDENSSYSQNAACPYYLSRALAKQAEIVFCPYNYLLDPNIREAIGIKLSGAVVVLDEAHNVEDTLRESGSGEFYEFELLELMVMLEYQSRQTGQQREDGADPGVAAHELLVFLEQITKQMHESKTSFENNPGRSGAKAAILESEKYHFPDNKEFEIDYFGPTGQGVNRKAVGCQSFFDRICDWNLLDTYALLQSAQLLQSEIGGSDASEAGRRQTNLIDRLVELISKLSLATKSPENFYISCGARANGSLLYASGAPEETGGGKNPVKIPRAHYLGVGCNHPRCVKSGAVVHCSFCDGSTPRWEAVFSLQLLNPGLLLAPIADKSRSLIFASGSLAPLGSFCSELGLSAASDEDHSMKKAVPAPMDKANMINNVPCLESPKICAKLQVKPPPLEANHVIDLNKQLRCVSIGTFPDGSPLTATYSNYKQDKFFGRLGEALATVVEAIPRGGVLIFVPSYSFLRNCVKAWQKNGFSYRHGGTGHDVWERFQRSKGTVVVEPSGSQDDFEIAKERYANGIRREGKALLLAVFRGKMSEGISFNDDNARAVVCVGLPFPNSHDRSVKAKKAFNDEMRNLMGNKNLLPGMEWYSQQAYRAIAQALGRCIRHAGDYGTVLLMDSRHCDDGSPVEGICRAHRSLPKWMRCCVRNLSMHGPRPTLNNANPPIFNGYKGLANELKEFFASAEEHTLHVMNGFQKELENARTSGGVVGRSFNNEKGTWT